MVRKLLEINACHPALTRRTKMQKMQMTPNGMDVLVMAELMRLQQDQSVLETLYQRLPDVTSQSNIDTKFLSLWSDVEKRADRLEYMLDSMA
jgi:hypothetical protein